MTRENHMSIGRLVLIPGLITLGVTILRLLGELGHWSNLLFNASPGGGGAIIGIVWLAPIFGIYFAVKLAGAGERPEGLGKATGFTFLALAVFVGGIVLFALSRFQSVGLLVGGLVLISAAILIPLAGWSQLAKALLAYGYFARIPVAVIMFFAIRGHWGTHYDGAPPNFPEMGFWAKYISIGLIPQLFGWVAFTIIVGSLLGIAATAIFRRKVTAPATT